MPIPRIRDIVDLLDAGRPRDALVQIDRFGNAFPFYPAPLVLQARAFEALGDTESALGAWRQAHFLLPNNEMVRAGLRRNSRRLLSEEETPLDTDLRDLDLTAADELEEKLGQIASDADPPAQPVVADRSRAASPVQSDEFSVDDLDELIAQLESGRLSSPIHPEEWGDPEDSPEAEEVVSETLARIYHNQKQFIQAARIYRILASQRPERAGAYLEKAEELENLAIEGYDESEHGQD